MFGRTLGVAATLALSANALMILPTVSIEPIDHSAFATLATSPLAVVNAQTQVLKLDCPDCPFLEKRHGREMIWSEKPVENELMFKFSVGSNGKSLEVNGVTAYPASPFRWPKSLRAPQLPAGADAKKIKGCMRNVLTISEYSWAFHIEGISDEGGEVIFGTFHPVSLENESIHVPSVSVKMIRDAQGHLTIASVTQEDADKALPSIGEPSESGECHGPMIFCKLKEMMKHSFKGFKSLGKGCGKKAKNAHGKTESHPALKDGDHSKSSDNDAITAPPQHGFARVAHILAHVSKMVLLPMLIGVLAGFLVYAVGMAVGLFIAFVWIAIRKWRAGGRGTYVHLSEDDEAPSDVTGEEEVDVKDMLKSDYISEKEQQEPLPVYQETDDKEVAPQ